MPLLMNIHGATGDPGATVTGPTGGTVTGPTGDPGDPGSPGATVTGPTGVTVTGPTGLRGTQWYNGTGAPTAGIGEVNDYYIDDTTGDLYVRDATGW